MEVIVEDQYLINGNLLGVAYASLDKLGWIKAALKEELKIPTDMGMQSKVE